MTTDEDAAYSDFSTTMRKRTEYALRGVLYATEKPDTSFVHIQPPGFKERLFKCVMSSSAVLVF